MPYVNGARRLCTVQQITDITPIEGADRIEVAKVSGWNVVVGKGLFTSGEKVAFFEIDTLCPDTIPAFDSVQKYGKKTICVDGKDISGHVIKTVRLRGAYSQGMIAHLEDFDINPDMVNIGDDLTDIVGVFKWEEPAPVRCGTSIGRFNPVYAPKSDAERVQNLVDYWEEIKALDWQPTVKIDGTSRTLARDDDGNMHIFSRNLELKYDETELGVKVAKQWRLEENLASGEAIQFELAGPGIQKNRLGLNELRPFVFSYWRKGQKVHPHEWWDSFYDAAVPFLDDGQWKPQGDLEEFISLVESLKGNVTAGKLDEGIVFHLLADTGVVPEFLDRTLCFKIINNKYLLKHKI